MAETNCLRVLCCTPQHVTAPLKLTSRAYSVVPPPRDSDEKQMLDRILRVDHAGEYGANRIYAGQMAVLGRTRTAPIIQVCVCESICLVNCTTSFFYMHPTLLILKHLCLLQEIIYSNKHSP